MNLVNIDDDFNDDEPGDSVKRGMDWFAIAICSLFAGAVFMLCAMGFIGT